MEINEQEAARSGESPYPLWDFSGYNSLTTEDVPPDGDSETQMKWYWESSHYKKELGDLVLDRIFDYHHPERIVPDDFGVLLTPKNIKRGIGLTTVCIWYHFEYTSFLTIYTFMIQFD